MAAAILFHLGIEHGKLVVQYRSTHAGAFVTRVVRDMDDLRVFLLSKADEAKVAPEELTVLLSSSIDFPEESTDDPATIALAKALWN